MPTHGRPPDALGVFFGAYVAAGGSPEACDPREIDFYQILGLMRGAVVSRYGNVLFNSGQKRDLLTANSGYDSHSRASRLLSMALTRAIAPPPGTHEDLS